MSLITRDLSPPSVVATGGRKLSSWALPVDSKLRDVRQLLASQADLKDRLEMLEGPAGEAKRSNTAAPVRKALREAGGVDLVVGRVVEARKIRGVFRDAALADAERRLATADASLEALGVEADADHPSGSHQAEVAGARKAAAELVERLRAEADRRHKAEAAELVTKASGGDGPAREKLHQEVRAIPGVFPPGLAQALEIHPALTEPIIGAVDELIRRLPGEAYRLEPTEG